MSIFVFLFSWVVVVIVGGGMVGFSCVVFLVCCGVCDVVLLEV